MVIAHNLTAMNAQRQYSILNPVRKKTTEKLASGYRINRAADDAANLSISEKMRRQIRGLTQTRDNIQDGISYCNVAEGALNEVSDMLHRIKELSVQAANGTNTDVDRSYIDSEVQQIGAEIDRIFKTTTFNEKHIWPPVLEPMASGTPEDYSLFKQRDDQGEFIGGISYMNHDYSWNDLGIDWDQDTRTFTENRTYKIDSTILKDDPSTSIDDYDHRGGSATFTITTQKGQSISDVQKNYSWSADSKGIRIDGVLTNGTVDSKEGNTTWAKMGIIPGTAVAAGEYSFNYYGMDVTFEVPDEMDWDDFTNAFNNEGLNVDWKSSSVPSLIFNPVLQSSSPVNKVIIDNDDKDNIANRYKVGATNDKVWIYSDANPSGEDRASLGKKSDQIVWTNLDNVGPAGSGEYSFGSWGTDCNSDPDSKTDKINAGDSNDGSKVITYSEDALYKYTDSSGYLTTNTGSVNFSFELLNDQPKADLLDAINSISFDVKETESPVFMKSNDTSKQIYVTGSTNDNISFYTQRDELNRDYLNDYEDILNAATFVVNGSDKYAISLDGYILDSNVGADKYSTKIYKTAEAVQNSMLRQYNDDVTIKRQNDWNDWVKANYSELWNKMSAYDFNSNALDSGVVDIDGDPNGSTSVLMNVGNQYVANQLENDFLIKLGLSNSDLINVLGLPTDAFEKDVDGLKVPMTAAEVSSKVKTTWSAASKLEKCEMFDRLSDAQKSTAIANSVSSATVPNSKSQWIYDTLNLRDDYDAFTNKFEVVDSRDFINFSIEKKIDMYKDLRNTFKDMNIADSSLVTSTYRLQGTDSIDFKNITTGDNITLNFDFNNLKYKDVIDELSDDSIRAALVYVKGHALTKARLELVNGGDSEIKNNNEVKSKLNSILTADKMTMRGDGESYQIVSYNQKNKMTGNKTYNIPEVSAKKVSLFIQAGVEAGQHIDIEYNNMRMATLGIRGVHVDTLDGANQMLTLINKADDKVTRERSDFGAYTNRMEHAYNANYNTEENTTAAESRIRDTDMSTEIMNNAKLNIIEQAVTSMMAQANQSQQGVLSLL